MRAMPPQLPTASQPDQRPVDDSAAPVGVKLTICLCTFNPRQEVLQCVLKSVAAQECDRENVHVLLIDNCSNPSLPAALAAPLIEAGFCTKVVREERTGIFHARNRAMNITSSDLVLWLDDDTELPPGYISQCLSIAEENPHIGCFGGRILAGRDCRYPEWCVPFLPYLAIINRGPEVISGGENRWGPWEPPTAGAVVRRSVIKKYLEFVGNLPETVTIGQVGTRKLLRGEDSLLMRMASRIGLQCSYQPSLHLWHHLDNRRFRLRYLLRLFFGYGRSFVTLERLLGNELPPMTASEAWIFLIGTRTRRECVNWQIFLAHKLWNLGFITKRGWRRSRK